MLDFEDAPLRASMSKSVLKSSGRRKGLGNLYDSIKWDCPWNRTIQRSWKKHRRTQYK